MSTFVQDLRYGLRRLGQAPGFTAVCIITLALGIGANTAIFTLTNAILLQRLPVANPQELYRLGNDNNCCVLGGLQDNWSIYSNALYKQFRDHTPEFSELAAFQGALDNLSVRRGGATGPAEPFRGEFVSGNYFTMFGVGAQAGRAITPSDDVVNAPPVAVMSYRTWQQHFGLDPSVIGSSFTLNQIAYTVVGVAPRGFIGDRLRADPPDFWIPLSTEPTLRGVNALMDHPELHWLYAIGRLRPGTSPASVQSKVTVQLQRWLSDLPDLDRRQRGELPKQHVVVAPAPKGIAELQSDPQGFRLLTISAAVVLVIACFNIANILLARGAALRAETAIRVALGAPRRRLVRQALTESVLLSVLGGAAGLAVAYLGARTILLLAFRGARYVPFSAAPALPVLGFAFLLSLVTGIVFGVAPAWITSRSDPAEALRGAGRSTHDHTSLPRQSLVMLQVALSTVMLIAAGLLARTLSNLENQRFGFQQEGRVIVRVNPQLAGCKLEKLSGLYQQLLQRLPQIPGVASASYSLYSPMRGENYSLPIFIEGRGPDERDGSSINRVGPHYFETIGTRLLRGRAIGDEDTPSSRQVTVVNETFARKFFPHEDPIGKHFGWPDPSHSQDYEIVGIVEDAKYQDAREAAYPTHFLAFLQMPKDPKLAFTLGSHYIQDIELRTVGRPPNLAADVRRTLDEIDPNLTVLDMLTLTEQVARNFNQDRLISRLTELFGLLALALACVGLYGVTAYSVARRTGEIGIRMALGANRPNVLRLVLRGAMLQLAVGLVVGVPAALGAGRLLASQLYGVKAYDPFTLGLAALVLSGCALAAGFVPAWRAASIAPVDALRVE